MWQSLEFISSSCRFQIQSSNGQPQILRYYMVSPSFEDWAPLVELDLMGLDGNGRSIQSTDPIQVQIGYLDTYILLIPSMDTKFSTPGAPLISNVGGPTVVRTSRIERSSGFEAPLSGNAASHIVGVTAPTVTPVLGNRGSRLRSPDEISPGSEVIRVENPPIFVYHDTSRQVQTVKASVKDDLDTSAPLPFSKPGERKINESAGRSMWLWLLLGLLVLGLFSGVFYKYLSNKQKGTESVEEIGNDQSVLNAEGQGVNQATQTGVSNACQPGLFAFKGKCIACPTGTSWNGASCVRGEAFPSVAEQEGRSHNAGVNEEDEILGMGAGSLSHFEQNSESRRGGQRKSQKRQRSKMGGRVSAKTVKRRSQEQFDRDSDQDDQYGPPQPHDDSAEHDYEPESQDGGYQSHLYPSYHENVFDDIGRFGKNVYRKAARVERRTRRSRVKVWRKASPIAKKVLPMFIPGSSLLF